MATIAYKVVQIQPYADDLQTQLNTIGSGSYELINIYNNMAILSSGSSGINVTGSVILPAGVVSSSTQIQQNLPPGTVSSSGQAINWTVLTSSYSDTASYVNPLNQNVSATGTITAGGNLISSNSSGDEGGEILLAKAQTNTTLTGSGITIDSYRNKLRIFEQGGTARGGYFDLTTLAAGVGTDLTRPATASYATTASYVSSVPTASVLGVLSYGQWFSTVTQAITGGTTASVTFESQSFAQGFKIVSASRFTALQSGVFNFQFSLQLKNSSVDNILYDIWFRENGVDDTWSNTKWEIDKQPSTFGSNVAALNYMAQMNSGSYLELIWSPDTTGGQIFATGSVGGPTRPGIPSAIMTVSQVG